MKSQEQLGGAPTSSKTITTVHKTTSIIGASDHPLALAVLNKTLPALAWPLVILTIVLMLRKQIADLVPLLESLKLPGVEAIFKKRLEEAEAKAEAIRSESGAEGEAALNSAPPDTGGFPVDYIVIDAWRGVERALTQLAEMNGLSGSRGRSALFQTRSLQSLGVLDSRTASLLDDLRYVRNEAAHLGPRRISRSDAEGFQSAAQTLEQQLLTLANQPRPSATGHNLTSPPA